MTEDNKEDIDKMMKANEGSIDRMMKDNEAGMDTMIKANEAGMDQMIKSNEVGMDKMMKKNERSVNATMNATIKKGLKQLSLERIKAMFTTITGLLLAAIIGAVSAYMQGEVTQEAMIAAAFVGISGILMRDPKWINKVSKVKSTLRGREVEYLPNGTESFLAKLMVTNDRDKIVHSVDGYVVKEKFVYQGDGVLDIKYGEVVGYLDEHKSAFKSDVVVWDYKEK